MIEIFIFALGFGVGVGASYVVMADIINRKNRHIALIESLYTDAFESFVQNREMVDAVAENNRKFNVEMKVH